MNVGRFVPEIIRIVQALQMADCSNGSTPANWMPGNPVIVPIPNTYAELQERVRSLANEKNGISWYLTFKEPKEECEEKIEICERNEEETE